MLKIIKNDNIYFSKVYEKDTISLYYNGDGSNIGCIINIHAKGYFKSPVIYNTKTKEKMQFNIDLNKDDELIINTNKGAKSIIYSHNDVKEEKLDILSNDSSWLSLNGGNNYFSYESAEEEGIDILQNIIITITANLVHAGV